jgi:multiple sugar transport system ATP-binding protein
VTQERTSTAQPIDVHGVRMVYSSGRDPIEALSGIDLGVAAGEFVSVVGPSGCGKSTLLKLVGGLEDPTAGAIHLDDELVNFKTPGSRNVAMVFQSYALYPHMTVRENIRFPLRMQKVPRAQADRDVAEAARVLDLSDLLDRPVAQLSGGQRQRAAVARAIVREPRVMLMDEPLSNLDALLRMQTREELLRLHRAMPGTIVYVTHDQVEAMTMGDRVGVMNRGRLVQVGTPQEIYRRPVDRFVAGFVGTPPMSFLDGTVAETAAGLCVRAGAATLALADETASRLRGGQDVVAGVRPEAVDLTGDGPWEVDVIEDLGHELIVLLRAGSQRVRARVHPSRAIRLGGRVGIRVDPGAVHVFWPDGHNVLAEARAQAALASATE